MQSFLSYMCCVCIMYLFYVILKNKPKKKDLFYVCRNAFIYIGLLDKYILKN